MGQNEHTFDLDVPLPADSVPLFELFAQLLARLASDMPPGDFPVLILTISAPPMDADGSANLTVLHHIAKDFTNPDDLLALARLLPVALLASASGGESYLDVSKARKSSVGVRVPRTRPGEMN